MARYRDTQLQVTENLCYLWNLCPNIYQCFKIEGVYYFYLKNWLSGVIQVLIKHRMSIVVDISVLGVNSLIAGAEYIRVFIFS